MTIREKLNTNNKLLQKPDITENEKVPLDIENIWINNLKDKEKRILQLDEYLNNLEIKSPEIYNNILAPDSNGLNEFQKIASRVSKIIF